MLGKIGIVFFALLALWLVLKSIIIPLCGQRTKQKIAGFIGWTITCVLFGTLIALVITLLHLFGSEIIELMKSFGLEKWVGR